MREKLERLRHHVERHVIGQPRLIERLLVAVITGGHVLLEGLPGLAKTTAVRALAGGMTLRFRRIQFTPDMIPGDITGTDIFVPRDGRFRFVPGPVFNDIILADEINRAPPKVQSALLEAMQEHQVTVGNTTHALPEVFMVIATQNPIEQEGTYPLPEAQLDRFQMKLSVAHPDAEEELRILRQAEECRRIDGGAAPDHDGVLTGGEILAIRDAVHRLYMDEMLERYVVTLAGATRDPSPWDAELREWITWGVSPRATLALARAARGRAFLAGRDFVEPDDIIALAHDVLGHRIGLSFSAHAAGVTPQQVIDRIVAAVPVP